MRDSACASSIYHLVASSKTLPDDSVNTLVQSSEVVPVAIQLAKEINANSPDAVQCTKKGLLLSQENNVADTARKHNRTPESTRVYKSENIKVNPLRSDILGY